LHYGLIAARRHASALNAQQGDDADDYRIGPKIGIEYESHEAPT
jgi:hypothetical protein